MLPLPLFRWGYALGANFGNLRRGLRSQASPQKPGISETLRVIGKGTDTSDLKVFRIFSPGSRPARLTPYPYPLPLERPLTRSCNILEELVPWLGFSLPISIRGWTLHLLVSPLGDTLSHRAVLSCIFWESWSLPDIEIISFLEEKSSLFQRELENILISCPFVVSQVVFPIRCFGHVLITSSWESWTNQADLAKAEN